VNDRDSHVRADEVATLEEELARREQAAEAARRTAAAAIARAEAAEAALAALHARVEELERHVAAAEGTRAGRLLGPPRRLYGSVRRTLDRKLRGVGPALADERQRLGDCRPGAGTATADAARRPEPRRQASTGADPSR